MDSETTNAVCGSLDLNNSRSKNHRWKSGTCARGSHENASESASLGLLPTHSMEHTLAWARLLRRRHRRSGDWKKALKDAAEH